MSTRFNCEQFQLFNCAKGILAVGSDLISKNDRYQFSLNITSNDSILLVDKHYCGVEMIHISDKRLIEIRLFILGVYIDDFYSQVNSRYIGSDIDLNNVYRDLLTLEEQNKNNFYSIFAFLADCCSFDSK